MLKPGQKTRNNLKNYLYLCGAGVQLKSFIAYRKKRTKSWTYTRRLIIQSPDVNLHIFLMCPS